jgi:hypothetical protein
MEWDEKLKWANRMALTVSAVGLWFWLPRWKQRVWKRLPLYISLIALGEWTGWYLIKINQGKWNPALYSFIIHPITFVFLYWIFGQYEKEQKRSSQLWRVFSILTALACIADRFFFSAQKLWFSSFSYLVGTLLLCMLLIRFFLRYLFSNQIFGFGRDIMFWFCSTLFIYYMGTFPFFAMRNTLANLYYDEIFMPYFYVQITLSALMYISFFIIYTCTKPK